MPYEARTGIAIEWLACTTAFAVVLLRIYAKWPSSGRDEWLVCIAWLLHCLGCTVDTALFCAGFAPPPYYDSSPIFKSSDGRIKTMQALQTMYADLPLQYLSLWSVKVIFISVYHKLIPRHYTRLRLWFNFVTAFVLLSLLTSLALNFLWCVPVTRNWDLNHPEDMCFSWNESIPYWTTMAFHLVTDIMIYALPFPVLRDLSRSANRNQYNSVLAMFSLGFFCVLCTVARAVCSGVSSTPAGMVGMFGAMEQASGIIVACGPALRKLLFYNDEKYKRKRQHLSTMHWVRRLSSRRKASTATSNRSNSEGAASYQPMKNSRVGESTDHHSTSMISPPANSTAPCSNSDEEKQ